MIHFITASTSDINGYADLTNATKQAYCDKYGHRFRYLNLDVPFDAFALYEEYGMNPYWKLVYALIVVSKTADEGDWLCLSGADSFIPENAPDVAGLINALIFFSPYLIISKDPNGLNNSGMLIRNCEWSRILLNQWWAMRGEAPGRTYEVYNHGRLHTWFEQAALILLLQDEDLEAYRHIKYIDQSIINAYPEELYGKIPNGNVTDQSLFVHLPNRTTEQRVEYLQNILQPA